MSIAKPTGLYYSSAIAGAYAVVGGVLSLIGRFGDIYRLTDWANTGISTKVNTAVAATAAGIALIVVALQPSARWPIRALGLFIATIGGLTLFEHISGVSLGIDTLLLNEAAGEAATAAPGRMGPPAALSFLMIGIALILLTCNARARAISVVLGLCALSLGLLSFTGYLYGAEAIYTLPRLTGIAMQTASMIAVLGLGIVGSIREREPMRTLCEDSSAGMMARRLLPLIVIVPLGLGWLRLQGQRLGFYDAAFGTAIRSIVEVALFFGLLWWTLNTIRLREQKQRQAEEALKEADRRKDEFLATLAHELRNPLAPILQAAEIVRMPAATPKQIDWSHGVIRRQARNMARLLDDLLDLSRITRGTLEIRKAPVELHTVVDAAVEIAHPAIDARKHVLSLDLPQAEIRLNVDALRLAQVIANLLTNAAKYSDPPGQIHLTAHWNDNELKVSVKDKGIGIAPDMLPKIFQIFVQAQSALDRTEGGLGIGLSLSKALVELHGGRLEARSAGLGQGSEFIIRLPLATEA